MKRTTMTILSVVVAVLVSVAGFGGVAEAVRPSRPLLSIANASVSEGNSGTTDLSLTITASPAPSRKGTFVSYSTANGTAIAPADYTAIPSATKVEIPVNATSVTITVPLTGDTRFESDETFFVNLRTPIKAKISKSQAIATILNDDAVPTVSIASSSVIEGDSGTTIASFPVTLSAASGRSTTVHYATSDGTATAGSDYEATNGDVTIPPGLTTAAVTVPVIGDTIDVAGGDGNETFNVTLSNPVNADLGNSVATGTIINNDPAGASFVSIGDQPSINEGNSGTASASFTISLTSPSVHLPVAVSYETANGSAVAGSDYQAVSGSVTIASGNLSATVNVPVIGDDFDEPGETFFVNISTSTTGIGVTNSQGAGTITNSDAASTISIANAEVSEGDAGTAALSFTATLSKPSGWSTQATYSTGGGTATADDYNSVSGGVITFAPSEVTQTIQVDVVGDTNVEPDETLTVTLSNSNLVHLSAGSPMAATGTILDDDAIAISIEDVRVQEPAAGTAPAVFTVTLSDAPTATVTVSYKTTAGTGPSPATSPADYTAVSATTLTFAPGQTTRTIAVLVKTDNNLEPDETFSVDLSAPTNAVLLDDQAFGVIVDRDAPVLSAGTAEVAEGGTAQIPVTLSAASTFPITVDYTTADGTASAPGDYQAVAGTLTIPAGGTTATIAVPTLGDAAVEPTETFVVNLSNPTNTMLAQTVVAVSLFDGPPVGSTGEVPPPGGVVPGPGAGGDRVPVADGYWLAATDGGLFAFGGAPFFGSTGDMKLNQPVVGMAPTPTQLGYWLVASDGGIFAFGDAGFFGSTGAMKLNQPIVGMTASPTGLGYWLVASDGGIFAFGDAGFFGSTGAMKLNQPIVGMTASPTGLGYWLVASDGGIFAFGDAGFFGSTGAMKLNQPIVGMTASPTGLGYWLVASDGGIFAFGDAGFFGSTGAMKLNQPIVGMTATPTGQGYWLVASDGGAFTFGDAEFFGSTGAMKLNQPIVGMANHFKFV